MDKSHLKRVYRDSLSLLTDLYELTMAYAYWKNGLADRRAVFQLFFRKHPFAGAYAICAGIETAVEYIRNFHFSSEDLAYLEGLKNPEGGPLFEGAFLERLESFQMEVDLDAMEEGSVVFAYQPILRVEGPIIAAQILESALLNLVNFQTLIATKASRVCFAAQGDHIVEFGLRRAQGIDGALSASRAAFIGGCHSTSNVLAGKLFGIPVLGTHAHSWVMTFDEEIESFRAFAKALPKSSIFLIDTYDTLKGVDRAIVVGKELKKEGVDLIAVRLDSGDLGPLSKAVRKKLDAAGFSKTKIMATNELTEQIIGDLKGEGAPIALWGVGTNLVTAKDQPALDGVYKMTAVTGEDGKWKYRLKISEQEAKSTHPGISGVRRYFDGKRYVGDMLYDVEMGAGKWMVDQTDPKREMQIDPFWEVQELLVPIVREGKVVYRFPSLEKARERSYRELDRFDPALRRLKGAKGYFCGIEKGLFEKKQAMVEEIKRA